MVPNQTVTRAGIPSWLAAGAAALLAAGCQHVPERSEPAPSAPVAPVSRGQPAEEQNAVNAALARHDSQPVAEAPAAPVQQPSPVLNPNAPQTYVVQRGDTLWGISSMFLRDPWLWPEIWHVNPGVANPHLIYPGDTLQLVYGSNGQPEIRVVPTDVVRVSPLVRTSALDSPIDTIPYKAIAAFLGRPGLLAKEDIEQAPKLAVVRDAHLVAGLADNIYITGMKGRGPGRYAIVRVGDEMKDPATGRVLGYMGAYAASARVDQADEKVTRGVLVESTREAIAGDLLFAEDVQVPGSDIIPHAPPAEFTGQIMAVVDGVTQIGQYDVVAVNRGSNDGLEVGHVLAIDQKGEVVPDGSCKTFGKTRCREKVQLPDERAGALLVFKTYANLSYGLVVEATIPVRVADQVRAP
jgi:LysM repeat protein